MGMAIGGACVLHAMLLMGAFHLRLERQPTAPAQRLQWRWVQSDVLPLPPIPQATAATASREPRGSTNPRPARIDKETARGHSLPPAVSTLQNVNTSATTPTPSGMGEHSESTRPAPAQQPLQLQLPASPPDRPSASNLLNQALNDGRSNTRRTTLENRIAEVTTGSDGLRVEDLGEGRKRVHWRGHCLDVQQARISRIDPMNEVSQRATPGVNRCAQ